MLDDVIECYLYILYVMLGLVLLLVINSVLFGLFGVVLWVI